ncbi:PqqD family protein [Fibrobacter sp.]|uniref:PqqD family protein n=1 Tax=Fibrobacter sp. TaxID=35828 RepID=UPI00345D6249|nr:PqqD family protein [Fibrobacter sp.]
MRDLPRKRAETLGEWTVDSLAEVLLNEYEVSPEQAKADVIAIVGEWQKVNEVE